MVGNNYVLWEDDEFIVKTPFNPQIAYSEGAHIIVAPKQDFINAWQDADVTARAFNLSAQICRIMEELDIAPWFNMQANGNWGLLPGATPFFHVHVYGRNRTDSWGKPVTLPELPKTYSNDPMPEIDRQKLNVAFKEGLN